MSRLNFVGLLSPLTLGLFLLSAPVHGQGAECDCSCEAYQRMLTYAEEARAAADSGGQPEFPAELMAMQQCAGQCAMQWAQCASPDTDFSAMNDRAAAASSAARDRDPEPESEPGIEKGRLTADYLAGTWCSVYGGQETTQWQFDDDGSYRIGLPAGQGYAMQPQTRSLKEFHDRFDRLVAMESDGFTTEHGTGRVVRDNVFTRGPCR
jgi:hypothetical protein